VGIISAAQFDGMVETARATVNDAIQFAEQSPWPDPARALDNVTGLAMQLEDKV
jgi:TPP-dependent pyruvate/acetoin dehydrogenase alpha subunit